ncbi:hypothetical protein BGZ89_006440 [Linnemannia elongata]|nr:hypothetical protein BGZ89_006440 [Linnemannia elongata]
MSGEADLFLNSVKSMTRCPSIVALAFLRVILLLASSSSTSVVVQAVPVSISTPSVSNSNPVDATFATTKRDETPGAVASIAQNTEQVNGVLEGLSGKVATLAGNTVKNNAVTSAVTSAVTNNDVTKNAVTNNDVVKSLTDSNISQGVNDAAAKQLQSATNIVGGDSTSTTDGTAAPDTAPQGGVVNQSA